MKSGRSPWDKEVQVWVGMPRHLPWNSNICGLWAILWWEIPGMILTGGCRNHSHNFGLICVWGVPPFPTVFHTGNSCLDAWTRMCWINLTSTRNRHFPVTISSLLCFSQVATLVNFLMGKPFRGLDRKLCSLYPSKEQDHLPQRAGHNSWGTPGSH